MLSLLHIENIAIIESADISFEPGFNVLTGETGAGKSIVIDSISAVLGQRTSRELIRTGARSALVTAVFSGLPGLPWLEENGFEQGEELLLQREIQGDGRNSCRINGRPLTVAQLRELGRQLLDIHGQHDGQQLLDPACHLGYLDRFARTGGLLERYREAFSQVTALRRQIAALEMDEAERARRVDALQYQIGELERAQLQPGEDEELDGRRTLLRSAGKLMEGLQQADFALSGDEDSQGACGLLSDAEGAVRGIARFAPQVEELARHKQVLCVTHLPQIAAMADAHFSVEKGERKGRTYTRVERLDRDGREGELARLLGGGETTPALLRSAQELLDRAEHYRKSRLR